MTYNIHPIIVHFPVALLFLYSVLKITPFKKWVPTISWNEIRLLIIFVGILGAFLALITGESAEHLIRPNHDLVEAHSTFASISTALYCALLVGELSSFINSKKLQYKDNLLWIEKTLHFLELVLLNRWFSVILALLALIAIIVTGLLGGVMVYALSADPLAPYLLKILHITL